MTKICKDCGLNKPLELFYRHSASKDGYRAYCKPCGNRRTNTYRKQNPEKINSYNRKYWHNNLEKCRKWSLNWAKDNPGKSTAKTMKRHAAKLKRIPVWANLKAIQKFYDSCPEGYEVDHIIPLQGKNISGLHILENLQYLSQSENRSKGNRF